MDAKPDLSRIPYYQYFNEIDNMEGMKELPKETWGDKFSEAVKDLQREVVRPKEGKDEDNGGEDDNREEGGEE